MFANPVAMRCWLQLGALFACVATACSGSSEPPVGADVVAVSDDRTPIPVPAPAESTTARRNVAGWFRWLGHEVRPSLAARSGGVTALDEVPDSTWFTNRNAVRAVSPDQIRRGPGPHSPPRDGARWSIVGTKHTGFAIGFRARDEAGDEFVLKFDQLAHNEVETGADVVVQRLLFAAGYNVPENEVVYVTRDALTVAPGSTTGEAKRALGEADIDLLLARAAREPDGRYRVLASRFLPGTPVGGIEPHGVRTSDPNDRVPHQDRRDMRGLYSLAAWLNHTDVKPANTLDVWIPDAGDPSRGHVVHYLLDFGKALGAMTRIDRYLEAGYAYHDEKKYKLVKHVAPALEPVWEQIGPYPHLRGLGWIESEHFDATRWIPLHRWLPFQEADRFDKFWGARIVMSFTPEQIRAALEAARYSEPKTVEYLQRVLLARQRKLGQQLFRAVAPLDRFQLRGAALCFDDLWVRYQLGPAETTYGAKLHGNAVWPVTVRAEASGSVCLDGLPPGDQVVEVQVTRPGQSLPPTLVHIASPTTGGPPSVVALDRR